MSDHHEFKNRTRMGILTDSNRSTQWSRTTRYFAFIIFLGFLIWFGYTIRELIAPLIISALLAYVLNPPISYVNSLSKLPRVWVVTLVYAILISLLGLAIFTLTPVAIEQSTLLADEFDIILNEFSTTAETELQNLGFNVNVQELVNSIDAFFSSTLGPDQIFRFVTTTSRNLVWILIIIVTTFYILQDWHLLRAWLFRLAPPAYQGDVRRLYGEIKDKWQAYLWGQILLMLVIGILSGVSSAAVGLQAAVVLGLIAGIFDVVPSVGPAVAMAIATIVAWFQGPPDFIPISTPWYVLLVLLVFVAIQTIENIWLRPRIMGQTLKMHPGIVFVAVMGGLAIGGILVALLIVPLIGTMGIIGGYLRARMFGLDPWPATMSDANSSDDILDNHHHPATGVPDPEDKETIPVTEQTQG